MKKFVSLIMIFALLSCGDDSQLIDGVVVNKDSTPLEGVLVQVMGTDLNSLTNTEGKFRINTRNRGEELIFTHPDYEFQRVEINSQSEYRVELTETKSLQLER